MDQPSSQQGAGRQYYCIVAGRQYGPVAFDEVVDWALQGRIPPEGYVWRPGLADWTPARNVNELEPVFTTPAVELPPPDDWEERRARRIVRNARQNCIVLFILFGVLLLFLLSAAMWEVSPESVEAAMGWWGFAVFGGALYAAIYFPIRWRTIMALPRGIKVLGLIGGFGLIAIVAISLLMLVMS